MKDKAHSMWRAVSLPKGETRLCGHLVGDCGLSVYDGMKALPWRPASSWSNQVRPLTPSISVLYVASTLSLVTSVAKP